MRRLSESIVNRWQNYANSLFIDATPKRTLRILMVTMTLAGLIILYNLVVK